MATAISRFFLWLRRHPRLGWTILLVYAAAVTFPHEEVQTLVGVLAKRMGRANLYRMAAGTSLILGCAFTVIFVLQLRRHRFRRLISVYWVATVLLIFAAWNMLTANNTELVHYPQYFVPGFVLMAVTLSPLESLAWITITGGLDECYQYWALHGGWGVPYDFNDICMDLLGGALGVVFAAAFLTCLSRPAGRLPREAFVKPGTALLAAIGASGAILFAFGKMLLYEDKQNTVYWFALSRLRPQRFWFFDETWGPKTFHTLSPLEGPVVLIAVLGFYAFLDRKLTFETPGE
jgi:energy-coupling factor transporter transmembrane protein EcfT